jgi:hypothetical protein
MSDPLGHTCNFQSPDESGLKIQGWGQGWKDRPIRYTILSYTNQISPSEIDAAAHSAFQKWARHGNFSFKKSSEQPHIKISFRKADDACPWGFYSSNGTILGHAFPPPPIGEGSAFSGQVHFNDRVSWSTSGNLPEGKFNIYSSMLHEIGHALGVPHLSTGTVMDPRYVRNSETPLRDLTTEDVAAIQKIYGPAVLS